MGIIGDIAGLFAGNNNDQVNAILNGLNPEAGASAYTTLGPDPALRAAQMRSLSALQDIAAGRLQPMDQIRQQQAMDAANRNEQGQRGAIMQHMAARGMAGSGAELAAQLAAQQGGANRAYAAGSEAAANANQRALSAIGQSGQMAGNIRGQDWGEAAQRAGALDAMSRFNAGQRVAKAGMQTGALDAQGRRNVAQWTGLGNDVENTAAAAYGAFGGGGGGGYGGMPYADIRGSDGWYD